MIRRAAVLVVVVLGLVGCSHGSRPNAGSSTARTTATATTGNASRAPSPTPVAAFVDFNCQDTNFNTLSTLRIQIPSAGPADYSTLWAHPLSHCDARRSGAAVSALEATALKVAAGGDTLDVLYELCAVVDPEDVYAEVDFVASPEQVPEISAALVLCPAHPHASAWKRSVDRGQHDIALAKEGRLFDDGVHLVGSEIKPGTYAILGDIEDCYWERQNRNGDIIQNNFISQAKRVQVTIKSSDYAFMSRGCGTWRPA